MIQSSDRETAGELPGDKVVSHCKLIHLFGSSRSCLTPAAITTAAQSRGQAAQAAAVVVSRVLAVFGVMEARDAPVASAGGTTAATSRHGRGAPFA